MSEGIAAKGTVLALGDGGGPEVFTQIAEVTSIAGPGLTADMLDVSSHSSPSSYREFVKGMKDAGEITLEINYAPGNATHKNAVGGLLDQFSKDQANWELTFSDAALTKWSFAAIVSAFEPSAPFDDKLTASITLKLTGVPTLV